MPKGSAVLTRRDQWLRWSGCNTEASSGSQRRSELENLPISGNIQKEERVAFSPWNLGMFPVTEIWGFGV